MGKKKGKGEYNDFLESARPRDNNDIRTTLQTTSALTRNISPPAVSAPQSQQRNHANLRTKPKKPPLTHFLCLPLVSDPNRAQISTSLEKLKKDVETYTPVPPKAVRPTGTLHLTLGVMSLSPAQLSDASTHLSELDIGQLLRGITTQKLAESVADTRTVSEGFGAVQDPSLSPASPALSADPASLAVELRALVPMQKPGQTSILYAEPRDATARLLPFAESLRRSFEEQGWVVQDERSLRLHATVLNTIYAKPKGRGRGKQTSKAAASTSEAVRDGGGGGGGDVLNDGTDGEQEKEKEKEKEERDKGHGPDAKSWMRFDASELIDMYKDFVWAEDVRIDRVQICKMGAQKIFREGGDEVVDERYEVVAEKML
ncbi:uncharacterized protein EKO05_0006465 [Ascochyta rabiei]|uniref:Catalytic n=1 Tax=Didymella rabiei TaxID=5454 RepID=A0A162W872_DIDRA|nr:uncharacterized protein EKO05_0006465 [Ascochyta rabiei]KZM18865.1 catalytic [Ascochyta rabiei]UPX16040.1 hypothetical protein EKO05_0006465 [Ascochyta rabiei]